MVRSHGIASLRVVHPDPSEAKKFAESADALVFENGHPGTGSAYDYSLVPIQVCSRAIIAGGLTISNLEQAKRMTPYGLDVSSGVERAPGRKDPQLVEEFIRRAKA